MGRERMAEMDMVEIGMDQYARGSDSLSEALASRSLHRNFMGFTAQYTAALVGLGVSALGHAGASYAQNEKSLQQYETRVAAGDLPLQRGHALGPDDLRVRRHLWNLMCASKTQVRADERELAWWQAAQQRLVAARRDGLVELDAEHITITPIGRAFLRQVCAALDPFQQSESQPMMLASA
jgi:oxygen-independent coproporphyrinogen-3 oxidase